MVTKRCGAPGATSECLILDTGAVLEVDRQLKERALARGVVLREVYPDSTRHGPVMQAYAKWLAAYGVPGRTVPDVPIRLLVADGSVAGPGRPRRIPAGARWRSAAPAR